MATRFWTWLDRSFDSLSREKGHKVVMAEYDERRRMREPLAPECGAYHLSNVLQRRGDDNLTWSVTDFVVARAGELGYSHWLDDLEGILEQSGSAWRIGTRSGAAGVERRVASGVGEAANVVMGRTGSAGELLSAAWQATFGIHPDPEKAYSKAIKAVEEAAKPRVSPKDSVATLGKMVSAMRDQKDWALPLQDDETNPSSDTVVKMMRSLHSGQQQRHGGNGDRAATQEEAEAALFLAVPLVQFFHGGLVARRS
ncbi:hypothetical protein EDF23_11352 [Curtobacterium sp. PhB128]|nr:hypothetical protein EDF23_11352 [Curtobacterium sp. PhB128]TCL90590.1 hypothetical protein EDF29_11365 [Curtobacterium sp. PhB138]TDW73550.1 hypothetical protein EDF51_102383 [Curtobacterium sp. PhB25]